MRSYGYFCQKMPASGTKRTLIQQSLISKNGKEILPAISTFRIFTLAEKAKLRLFNAIALPPIPLSFFPCLAFGSGLRGFRFLLPAARPPGPKKLIHLFFWGGRPPEFFFCPTPPVVCEGGGFFEARDRNRRRAGLHRQAAKSTPSTARGSIAWRADRRRDPTPINSPRLVSGHLRSTPLCSEPCTFWNHCAARRVGISCHRWTERVADDTGNRDACANCLADLYDDKRSSVRCRRYSCTDVARTERQCRLLDFSGCCGELHFGSAHRVVDRPSNARPLLATAEGR